MAFIRNIKIGAKLTMGFAIVLLFVLALAVYGTITMNSVGDSYQRILDYPNARFILVEEIDMAVTDIRHYTAVAALHAGDLDAIARFEGYINENRELLAELAREFRENMEDDEAMSPAARSERNAELNSLMDIINSYVNNQVMPIIAAARANDLSLAVELIYASLYVNEEVDYAFYDLSDDIIAYLEQAREDNVTYRQNTIRNMIIVSAAALAIGIIIAVFITKMITAPIREVSQVIDSVSNGNLAINFKTNLSKDEVGVMTQNAYNMVNIIKNMVEDIKVFAYENKVNGDIEYRIDTAKYHGSYKEMLDSLTEYSDDFVNDMLTLLGVLSNVNDGNFNAELRTLPGKKIILNQNADALMANLIAVNTEIKAMIEAVAVRGDLSFQVDTGKYKGDWQTLMIGLNDITKAVDKPLKTIAMAMVEMKEGNFDLQAINNKIINAGYDANASSYAGVFREIIIGVESVIETTASYIQIISDNLKTIASGDLTATITQDFVGSYSEIKDSLNSISTSLNKTMSEINSASEQVLSGAKQISASAMDLANGASTQASSVEELNASVDLINQQTKQNADNAAEANLLSQTSTDNAREGNSAMQQTLGAMNQIKDSSNNISKIIRTIQDIAFQTNLLALNAAVEAARAGEHGKGFAVVAEEVRSLAARSQEAASETTELIGTSINTVETGSQIAQSTAETLNTIVDNANKVLDIVSNISTSSQEQAEAISQVVTGLQQISQVVQANSAVSEEAAAASEELTSQAEILQQLVGFFKL